MLSLVFLQQQRSSLQHNTHSPYRVLCSEDSHPWEGGATWRRSPVHTRKPVLTIPPPSPPQRPSGDPCLQANGEGKGSTANTCSAAQRSFGTGGFANQEP